jgi:glycosyltransferase involved in cell wall biosynthesis
MRLRPLAVTPFVSVLVTAYNVERFIAAAIDSALAVNWPADRLEIVVVNDGSTDNTLQILESYGDQIRLLTQPNQGCVAAMNACLEMAQGDVFAFLDGDDEWPRDKLRRQIRVLQKQRQVGLVYGDVEIIDANGAPLMPSFLEFGNYAAVRGRVLGQLLPNNFAITGSIVVRADLRDLFWPIPPDVHSYDWYVASRIAEAWELDYVTGSVGRYRFHNENMTLGRSGAKAYANNLNDVIFARRMLRTYDLSTVSTAAMINGLALALARLSGVMNFRNAPIEALIDIDDDSRVASTSKLDEAWACVHRGNLDRAMRTVIEAVAHDLGNEEAVLLFDALFNLLARSSQLANGAPPEGTRTVSVRADAVEVVANPEMLSKWSTEFSDADDVTLVLVVEPDKHDEVAARLLDLASRIGLDSRNAPDITLHPCDGPEPLRFHVAAVYSRSGTPLTGLKIYDDTKLSQLHWSLAIPHAVTIAA